MQLAGLERSPIAVWVYDPDEARICWANDAALLLWRATSREELYARSMRPIPESVQTRFDANFARARAGEAVWADWTFFPRGEPVRARLQFQAIRLDDGRVGALQQAIVAEEEPAPEQARGVEALLHTSLMVALVEFSGAVLMCNPAALATFGADADWRGWLVDAGEAAAILREAAGGEVVRQEVRARTRVGERWHAVEARRLRDVVSGELVVLVQHSDETARRGAEDEASSRGRVIEELDRALRTVEAQRQEIVALSAPLLEVGPQVLALPIIGGLDTERGAEVCERLLHAVRDRRASAVILDFTGSATLDVGSAALVGQILRAVALLGARVMVTGIGPAQAAGLAEARVSLAGAAVLRSLAEAIAAARGGARQGARGLAK